ncbi:MAG: hypothetical protein AAFV80_23545, partial [Bacteroidota bacterium]
FILVVSGIGNLVIRLVQLWVTTLPEVIQEDVSTIINFLRVFSVVFFVLGTLWLVNQYWWKYKIFKWLIDLPDLNGRYVGELVSSFKDESGNPVKKLCALEIRQTASSISVAAYYADADSQLETTTAHSVAEGLEKDRDGSYHLFYTFANEADLLDMSSTNHSGIASLTYFPDVRAFKGNYFNQRLNKGTIVVRYDQPTLLHRYHQKI